LAHSYVVATAGIASITANGVIRVQGGGHLQRIENKRPERMAGDDTSESDEFSEVLGKRGLLHLRDKLVLLDSQLFDF
jgi:hypothetical protein